MIIYNELKVAQGTLQNGAILPVLQPSVPSRWDTSAANPVINFVDTINAIIIIMDPWKWENKHCTFPISSMTILWTVGPTKTSPTSWTRFLCRRCLTIENNNNYCTVKLIIMDPHHCSLSNAYVFYFALLQPQASEWPIRSQYLL